MIESKEIEVNPESSKNEIINTSTNNNTTTNSLNNNVETLTIKSKEQQSKFEIYIINAYKKLVGFPEKKPEVQKLDKKTQIEEAEKLNINACELELRKALEEIESVQNISLNKNIIDKASRICKRNKINLSLLIGEIYIQLMNRKNLFVKLNKKISLNKNIIINFINEVINMNSLLKNTYLCIKYDNALYNFLGNIIKEITFDSEQLDEINIILEEHKNRKDSIKLNTKTSKDLLESINLAFNKQNSLYAQHKIVLDNSEDIINLINNANLNDQLEIENFTNLGILFLKLFFGKKCILLNAKNSDEKDKNKDKIIIKKFFDGFDNNSHGNINIIFGEKFLIDYDSDLEPLREDLCEIIIKFIEKFKSTTNLIDLQYILFVLLKRIYFYYFDKFEEAITPLFVQVLINLCIFQDNEKINPVIQFINELLNSKNEQDSNFKELLKEKIEEAKNNNNFNFNPKENATGNLETIQNEVIYVEEPNLYLGFFTDTEIEAGESLALYVELSKSLGFIDLTLLVHNYDINFTVTNLSEGKVIYQEKKLKSDKGLKLNLFFTKPGIFKFEFDNSYSWIRNKNISYNISTFYPQCPTLLDNKVSISKYQELLNNVKKIGGKKFDNENKLEIIQDQLAYHYNINDIKQNIELLNSMIISFQVKILSIYLDKENEEGEGEGEGDGEGNETKYFYVEKDNLEKTELTKENFQNYINENKNKNGTTIVNLFIISGDENEVLCNRDLSLEKVLGFEPNIEHENNNLILFFIEYYDQAQLLYYLCNKAEDQQNALLMNYSKIGGYQACIYVNGEIFGDKEEFKNLNKGEFLEKNMEIISGYVKKLGQEKKIKIIVTDSIDPEEKNITAEKMSEKLQNNLGIKAEEEGNFKIIKLNKDYNKEVERFNHLLNLIE